MRSASGSGRGRTPQQKGFDFEKRFGSVLGVKPTKGSGSQWYAKFDINSSSVLFSLKYTTAQSFRVEKAHLKEIQDACVGEQEPAMAIDVDGEVYVLQRAGDWIASRKQDAEARFIPSTLSEQRRANAKVPALLRSAD